MSSGRNFRHRFTRINTDLKKEDRILRTENWKMNKLKDLLLRYSYACTMAMVFVAVGPSIWIKTKTKTTRILVGLASFVWLLAVAALLTLLIWWFFQISLPALTYWDVLIFVGICMFYCIWWCATRSLREKHHLLWIIDTLLGFLVLIFIITTILRRT